jgi:hypothetical protein
MSDEHTINLKFDDWDDKSSGLEDAELQLGDDIEELNDSVKELNQSIKEVVKESRKPAEPEKPVHPYDKEIEEASLDLAGGRFNKRVRIADLKDKLHHLDPKTLEERLWEMELQGALTLYPLDDPQERTARDKAAAIHTPAGSPRHILYYGEQGRRELKYSEQEYVNPMDFDLDAFYQEYTKEVRAKGLRGIPSTPLPAPNPPPKPSEPLSPPEDEEGMETEELVLTPDTDDSEDSDDVSTPPTPPPAPPTPSSPPPTDGSGSNTGGSRASTPPPPTSPPPPTPVTPPIPPTGGGGGGGLNPALLLGLKALPWLVLYRSMMKFNDSMERTAESVMGFSDEVTQATVEARLLDLQANMRRADNIGDILGDYVSGMGELNNSMKGLWDEVVRFFSTDMRTVLSILKIISDTLAAILYATNYIRETITGILSAALGTNYSLKAIFRKLMEWWNGKDDEPVGLNQEIADFFKVDTEAAEERRRGDPRP